MRVILITVLLAGQCIAEYSLLYYSNFSELPDGWTNEGYNSNGWTFNHPGALASGSTYDDDWSVTMESPASVPGIYFVPDGTDSVVVHIEHQVSFNGDGSGSSKVTLTSTTFSPVTIYYKNLIPPSTYDDESIHWVLEEPPTGTWLGFIFHAYLGSYYAQANGMSWHVYTLEISAYGTNLQLEATTWAGIKNTFYQDHRRTE